jgi:hypothetical protein
MRLGAVWLVLGLGLVLSNEGCKSKKSDVTPAPGASVDAAISAAPAAAPVPPAPAATPAARVPLPEGPVLAIQAGQGVGPIRIGATVKTIERLMEAPCEVKTADACRYVVRAVEFDLKDGVTERIVVHRKDRPAGIDAQGRPQAYGFFNGGIPPGVGLGMVPSAVLEILGKPVSSERVTVQNDNHTVDRDTYPGGLVLEYDEYTNGKVMLGGVIITQAKK